MKRYTWSQLKRMFDAKDRRETIKILKTKGEILASFSGLLLIKWNEDMYEV